MESLAESHPSGSVKHPFLKTILAWDLYVAVVFGAVTGVGWWLTESEAERSWLVAGIPLAIGLAVLSWNQWNTMKASLRDSDYGKLLHIGERNAEDIQRPYSVVTYVSLFSALWTTVTAFLLDVISPTWESILIGIGVFLLAWAFLGTVSLKMISDRNDRKISELESFKEETARAQRELIRRRRESGQST